MQISHIGLLSGVSVLQCGILCDRLQMVRQVLIVK
jgi:hypothetical protein